MSWRENIRSIVWLLTNIISKICFNSLYVMNLRDDPVGNMHLFVFSVSHRVMVCNKQPTSPSSTAMKQWERSVNFDHPQKEMPSYNSQKLYSQEINDKSFCYFWQLFYQTVPKEFCGIYFASRADNQKSF